jgi:hypothetical protein
MIAAHRPDRARVAAGISQDRLNLGNGAGKHELRGTGRDPAIVIPNHVFHLSLPRGPPDEQIPTLPTLGSSIGSVITRRLRRASAKSGASQAVIHFILSEHPFGRQWKLPGLCRSDAQAGGCSGGYGTLALNLK